MIRTKYLTAFQLYRRSELVGNQDLKADIALSHTWNVARDIEKKSDQSYSRIPQTSAM